MARPGRRTVGQAMIDVLILVPASWFAVVGWVVAESPSRQEFRPPTGSDRAEAFVQAGAAWLCAAVLVAMVLARSRRNGWAVVLPYRVPAVLLVLVALLGLGMSLFALAYASPIGLALLAMVVGAVVLAVELLRRP